MTPATRRRVVLDNPKAPCFTLPLALLVGESTDSVATTLHVAKRLREYGSGFRVARFTCRPCPGTPITEHLVRQAVARRRGRIDRCGCPIGEMVAELRPSVVS